MFGTSKEVQTDIKQGGEKGSNKKGKNVLNDIAKYKFIKEKNNKFTNNHSKILSPFHKSAYDMKIFSKTKYVKNKTLRLPYMSNVILIFQESN